jgi:hypothetical protein
LGDAIRNVAYLAGDPDGGAPSFPPVQDSFVHPYPQMSMWGDRSVLRRILDDLDASGGYTTAKYDALSIADKATLHSAACTLSLLAYNVSSVNAYYDSLVPPSTDLPTIAATLLGLITTGTPTANQIAVTDADTTEISEWLAKASASGTTADEVKKMEAIAEYFQIERDRHFGFLKGVGIPSSVTTPPFGTYIQASGEFTLTTAGTTYTTTGPYNLSCDPNLFSAKGITDAEQALTLALALCPKKDSITTVKYPSLYYIFPTILHDHDGQDDSATAYNHSQPTTEEYIADTYIGTKNGTDDGTAAERYPVLTNAEITGIAAAPASTTASSWVLPASANANALTNPDSTTEAFRITLRDAAGNETGIDVPFIDKGLFNGREQLALRVLDIDIDAITRNTTGGSGNNDYWLPSRADNPADANDFATRGIVYAYREDAVREDEIVRPAGSGTDCAGKATSGGIFKIETETNCKMLVQPGTAIQDPPLQDNDVSMKPVDFLPDPDRRPHGFRFKTSSGNPADFSGGTPSTGRQAGMTFVSDNTAFIQGNFNLHSSDGTTGNFLEEFTYTIQDKNFDDDDFYDQRTAAKLNLTSFADLSVDHWRP